jgi:TolA-binding protein
MKRQVMAPVALLVTLLAFAAPASAQQSSVSPNDIQRLQDQAYQAGSDVSRLRSNDPNLASRLEDELDELRDEIVYLKVKARKDGNVSRTEYTDLRDRLQDLRSRARSDATVRGGSTSRDTSTSPTGGVSGGVSGGVASTTGDVPERRTTTQGGRSAIPEGQEIDVRLERELSSATANVEDRFEATTVADLYRGNEVLIPAGSTLRGIVSSVQKAGRLERKGSLTASFDQISVNGRSYPMRGTVTQALESEGIRGEAGRIGAGAGVGAIIGGILGGVKGALLGVLIGGGGTIAATEGKDVTLPAGTILRVRLDQPPGIR